MLPSSINPSKIVRSCWITIPPEMQECEPYNNFKRLTDWPETSGNCVSLTVSAFIISVPEKLFFHSICFTSNLVWNCRTFQDLGVNNLRFRRILGNWKRSNRRSGKFSILENKKNVNFIATITFFFAFLSPFLLLYGLVKETFRNLFYSILFQWSGLDRITKRDYIFEKLFARIRNAIDELDD